MFSINLGYPSFEEEVQVVKLTTTDVKVQVNPLFSAQEILDYQNLIKRMPVADNVIEYAVRLVTKTRPAEPNAPALIKQFIDWGAGPRASQNLIIAAKTHAAFNGKFSPDIENVKAVAYSVLRHRLVKNYKADAENLSIEDIIKEIL
jgi:MoxR-like ATPase